MASATIPSSTWSALRASLFTCVYMIFQVCTDTSDVVQSKTYISVPKTLKFQSGPRVVKKVLNTQWYTMEFHHLNPRVQRFQNMYDKGGYGVNMAAFPDLHFLSIKSGGVKPMLNKIQMS